MKVKFITGGAGTGKSYRLRQMLKEESRKFVVAAPTGIAAQNINGATIHSAFNINPDNLFFPPSIVRGPLAGLEVAYIDEISMCGESLFRAVYKACKVLGVQEIICFGDLSQLPPVKDRPFHNFRLPDEIEELTTVYRQADDKKFAEVLNAIRTDDHTYKQIQWLNKNASFSSEEPGVTLAFSNAVVDSINTRELHKVEGDLHLYTAKVGGGISERDVLAPRDLYIKEGAQVMFLNNDQEGRWKNGTVGTVTKCYEDKDAIQVRIKDNLHDVLPYTWCKKAPKELRGDRMDDLQQMATSPDEDVAEYARHCLDNGYELTPVGTFEQLPVKLAYAMTVHKSQGMTLDRVKIIPDGFYRMHGIGYVALSRLTSLAGLTLSKPLKPNDFKLDSKILI
jgi:ATP-dependent exoDNAse (exonuclease V) alpha subunit